MKSWLGVAFVCASVGCGGPHRPLPGEDMSGSVRDMAVPGGGGDMSVPGDLGPADMAIPNDAAKPVLYSQFASDYAKVLCAHLAQCGQVGTSAAEQAACMEANAIHWGIDYDTEIMSGHIVVNELQCLDAIMNSRCDNSDFAYVTDRCVSFLFQPQQHAGQSCIDSRECVNGYCLFPAAGAGGFQPSGCPGTCQNFKTTTCDALDSCNRAIAICLPSTHMCQAKLTEGQTCGAGVQNNCQFGLYCPSYGTQKCTKPAMQMNMGGTCDPVQAGSTTTPPCAAGLVCLYNAGKTTATCQPKIAMNAQCDPTSYQFFYNTCADGLHCDATQTPNPLCKPYGQANDGCSRDSDCRVDFYCHNNKCTAKIADGQSCTANSCISSQSFSKSEPDTCIVPNGDAGAATSCQPYLNVGANCNPGFDDGICYQETFNSNYCAPNANGGGRCAPKCM